jgi:hypothetical protein
MMDDPRRETLKVLKEILSQLKLLRKDLKK